MSGSAVSMSSQFEDRLSRPHVWCDDLLDELAETHDRMFTCDMQGTYRGYVNDQRRGFLENVLGLAEVEYQVCIYCKRFDVEDDGEWPTVDVCPDCEGELPDQQEASPK